MSKGKVSLGVVGALIASLLLPVLAAAPAAAVAPDHVSSTLEGCKPTGTSYQITVGPPVSAICTNNANYTPGNLGKSWNELDLVPYRLTMDAGNAAPATQTYQVAIVLDSKDNGHPGYDVISAPVLNTALSDPSCTAATSTNQQTATGIGGIDESIYRILTITQLQNTTCVYDYFGRLAVGAHLFPGSSLHANVANQNLGGGQSDVSIPVKEISPQSISKTMTATQNTDHIWSVNKEANPANLPFGNVCDTENFDPTLTTEVTVTWTKGAADPSGVINIHTLVEATNPAARVITVNVSDQLYTGTTPINSPTVSGPIDVPANTTNFDIMEFDSTVPDGTDDLNNIATATYTDKLLGVPVPGNAKAYYPPFNTDDPPVQDPPFITIGTGDELNPSATITDTESITGAGLTFSVAAPSVGSFTGGYVAGTATTGPVDWTSGSQANSGSVTFTKTITVDPSVGATSGSLDDTATLTGADGASATANASVTIDSTLAGTLTINKTTTTAVDEETDFVFHVTGPGGFEDDITITFPVGASGPLSGSLSGLAAGTYSIVETASGPFAPALIDDVVIGAGACDAERDVQNTFGPASLQAFKVTNPAGAEAGWVFNVTLDGNPFDTGTTDATGTVQWDGAGSDTLIIVDEGEYVVTEVEQDGYTSDGGNGTKNGVAQDTCTFTVDFPADADATYTCTFTNTRQEANATVKKITVPAGFEADWHFELFLDNAPAGAGIEDTFIADADTTGTGAVDFGVDLADGDYYVVETPKDGFESDGGVGCEFTVSFPDTAGDTFACTFTNTATGTIKVAKTVNGQSSSQTFVFELRQGAADTDPGTGNDTGGDLLDTKTITANGTAVQLNSDLAPGTYQVCELLPAAGWTTNLGTNPDQGHTQFTLTLDLSNERVCVDVDVTVENQDIVLTVDNTPPPGGAQLTIGFWKNHASCKASKGKQAAILDATLTKAGTTLIGDLSLTGSAADCVKAVNVLNKTTIDGKTKKASDPLFNMAAQLLAAKLNVTAGAGTCLESTQAINDAQALLVKYHWNGLTYSPALTAADKTLANNLNTLLDRYNNGLLC